MGGSSSARMPHSAGSTSRSTMHRPTCTLRSRPSLIVRGTSNHHVKACSWRVHAATLQHMCLQHPRTAPRRPQRLGTPAAARARTLPPGRCPTPCGSTPHLWGTAWGLQHRHDGLLRHTPTTAASMSPPRSAFSGASRCQGARTAVQAVGRLHLAARGRPLWRAAWRPQLQPARRPCPASCGCLRRCAAPTHAADVAASVRRLGRRCAPPQPPCTGNMTHESGSWQVGAADAGASPWDELNTHHTAHVPVRAVCVREAE
jgi:hypothetical protein